MEENKNCPFCNAIAKSIIDYEKYTVLYECPTCGRFKLSVNSAEKNFLKPNVKDMVATYLFYNGVHYTTDEILSLPYECKRQYIWLDDKPHKSENNDYFEDVTLDQVKAFYNVNFSQKISMILLDIAKKTRFFDDWVIYSFNQILSMIFGKRWDNSDNNKIYHIYSKSALTNQILFIIGYLKNNHFIDFGINDSNGNYSLKMLASG